MRVVEFRIPLPITVEEYQICQRFNVALSSLEQTVNGPDGVEFLVSEPFVDEHQHTGHYTHKCISVASKVPSWIYNLVKKEWFTAEEKSWNTYPRFKTCYKSSFMPNLQFTVLSMHCTGVPSISNALNLDEELLSQRSIVDIDIINDRVQPKDYKEEEDPQLSSAVIERFGTLAPDWIASTASMTCYKVLLLHIPFGWGVSGRVECWIVKALQNMLLLHHRRAVCTLERWSQLTLEEVIEFELYTKDRLAEIWEARRKGEPVPDVCANDFLSKFQSKQLVQTTMEPPKKSSTMTYTNLYDLQVWEAHQQVASGEDGLKFWDKENVLHMEYLTYKEPYEGYMYKLSDGFLNSFWNLRYIRLEGSILRYYGDNTEMAPREALDLTGAYVTWCLEEIRGRSHVIAIELMGRTRRPVLRLSAHTENESKEWMLRLQLATLVNDAHSTLSTPSRSWTSNHSKDLQVDSHDVVAPCTLVPALRRNNRFLFALEAMYNLSKSIPPLIPSTPSFPTTVTLPLILTLPLVPPVLYTYLGTLKQQVPLYTKYPSQWESVGDSDTLQDTSSLTTFQYYISLIQLSAWIIAECVDAVSMYCAIRLRRHPQCRSMNTTNFSGYVPITRSFLPFLMVVVVVLGYVTAGAMWSSCVSFLLQLATYVTLGIVMFTSLVFVVVLHAEIDDALLGCAYHHTWRATHKNIKSLDPFTPHNYVIGSIFLPFTSPRDVLISLLSTTLQHSWNHEFPISRVATASIHTDSISQLLYHYSSMDHLGPSTRTPSYGFQRQCRTFVSFFLLRRAPPQRTAHRHWGLFNDGSIFVVSGPFPNEHHPVKPTQTNASCNTSSAHELQKLERIVDSVITIETLQHPVPHQLPVVPSSTLDYILLVPQKDQRGYQLIRCVSVPAVDGFRAYTPLWIQKMCSTLLQRRVLSWMYQLIRLKRHLSVFHAVVSSTEHDSQRISGC